MNLENEFVPYEQALALKELGFDEPCLGYFDPLLGDYTIMNSECINPKSILFNHNTSSVVVSAPLYQQAFRWFRDMYNLMIPIYKDDIDQYYFSIPNSDRLLDTTNYCSESYEEAELECLKKLIELLKTNKI